MTVSVLGCGWYGRALGKALIKTNIPVKGSVTENSKKRVLSQIGIVPYLVRINPRYQTAENDFFKSDVLIISIAPKFRQGEGDTYLGKLQHIINLIELNKIKKVIYISSTGVYGDYNREVDELSDSKPDDEQGKILSDAENLFKVSRQFRTTVIRFGGLIGPGRDPGRFFAGRIDIPNGLAPVNLLHLEDAVGITLKVISCDCFGYTFNAVMPNHPGKAVYYTRATANSGLPVPSFINELKRWKIVNSLNLDKILDYKFQYPDPEGIEPVANYNI